MPPGGTSTRTAVAEDRPGEGVRRGPEGISFVHESATAGAWTARSRAHHKDALHKSATSPGGRPSLDLSCGLMMSAVAT